MNLSTTTESSSSHFNEIYHLSINKFALRPVAGALATIERLRERGYELDQSDALKIMKIFAIYGLFKKSTDVLKSLYDDKKFARKATELMLKPDLSFYKFIQLQPKEVKEEPSDTLTNARDDHVSDLVAYCKVENCESSPINESTINFDFVRRRLILKKNFRIFRATKILAFCRT
ncbi:unnamed protein product [Trichogramma brassicae]|uniref:Uncharacterized protein n=1 Tax=Trichogramma brassicae TaxID=86971 RepID=A0A6H5IV84_9HYME|nr:unnamed protein product [Trichogramma brassicae]